MTPASGFDQQENNQESREETPDETEKGTMMDVNESMIVSSEEFEDENEEVPNDGSKQQISQDALRKLQRDMIEALTKQHESSKTAGEVSEEVSRKYPGRKAKLEARDGAMMTRKMTAEDEECRSSMKNQEVDATYFFGESLSLYVKCYRRYEIFEILKHSLLTFSVFQIFFFS